MNKIKFKIYTLGCKVNQYDSAVLVRGLTAYNLEQVSSAADLVIINTCAVTHSAIVKAKRMIVLAREENPRAKIALAGCWVKTYSKKCQVAEVDFIFDSLDAQKIVALFAEKKDIKNSAEKIILNPARARYFIKIQDGCEQFCSYCIIPYARGKLCSRKGIEVLEEIRQAVLAGYQEIVVCGIHLGLYGQDNEQGSLVDILKKIIKIKGLGRVRLSSIEITEVSDELIALMQKNKKICPHLHIPLQSGSDKILKLMNRPYDTKYFIKRVKKIREVIPDIAITTDVIVGFPGETEKESTETFDFVKKIKFSRLHIFSFSPHEKTPAVKLPGRVLGGKIKERTAKLRKLGENSAVLYRKFFIDKELKMVVEHIAIDGTIRGKSENYLDIKFKNKHLANKIVLGEIIKIILE